MKKLEVEHIDDGDESLSTWVEEYEKELRRLGWCISCQGYGQDMGDGSPCKDCQGTGELQMSEDKKQRIKDFATKLVEKTLYHRRDDAADLIQSQIEACEKWDDEFFDAAEKLLNNDEGNKESIR